MDESALDGKTLSSVTPQQSIKISDSFVRKPRQTLTGRRKTMMMEKLLALQREMEKEEKTTTYDAKTRNYRPKDEKDVLSVEPSYTSFQIPYEAQCRMRYAAAKMNMEKKFQKELKLMEMVQPTAYEAARFNRHLAITTFWPALHNQIEIKRLNRFFERNEKENMRLRYLLNNEQL